MSEHIGQFSNWTKEVGLPPARKHDMSELWLLLVILGHTLRLRVICAAGLTEQDSKLEARQDIYTHSYVRLSSPVSVLHVRTAHVVC